jgi:hypothetical protein
VCNCAPCHLPNVDDQIDSSLTMVLVSLRCILCARSLGTTIMLICDHCSQSWHMGCLMPTLEEVLIGKCFYLQCTK